MTITQETADNSAQEVDRRGYVTIADNPITRAGVFQYKGSQLPGGDPNRIYNVYRPIEELSKPETLESFAGLPIIDEHEMLGQQYDRYPEERGTHGSVLESIRVSGNDVLAKLRIWSRTLKSLIDSGKKGLSVGYNCVFEKSSGIFEGMPYDYIQRNIVGNHLALVNQGRSGTAVLDRYDIFDHFDLALDNGEIPMAEENKKEDDKVEKKAEISLDDVHGWAKSNMPKYKELLSMMGEEGEEDETKDGMALDEDTKEKEGDQALDEDEEDKKEEKKKDKAEDKKEAMDADDINRLVTSKVKTMQRTMMADVAKRDALARDLKPLVGTFDCSAMDCDDVAAYGVKKLGLSATKGHERATLDGYLAGVKKSSGDIGFAMDSANGNSKITASTSLGKRLAKASV